MRHGKKHGNRKATRFCEGMEIVASRPGRTQAKPVKKPRTAPRASGAFAIVETVTGPIAGTFGLSEVWERG